MERDSSCDFLGLFRRPLPRIGVGATRWQTPVREGTETRHPDAAGVSGISGISDTPFGGQEGHPLRRAAGSWRSYR
jgi:hypothetical protein